MNYNISIQRRVKMTLKVEFISTQTIKPSSPTPPHLKTYNLSLIDQYCPPVQLSLALFYSAHDDKPRSFEPLLLKKSLSEILTQFYPLAGRISDNQHIICNDEGVNFLQTQVHAQLSDILSSPTSEEIDQLLPKDKFYGLGPNVLLSIQVNMFDCGGMALGVSISHKAADASSFGLFLNNWAKVTRGDNEIIHPKFDLTSFFPPTENDVWPATLPMGTQKVVDRRFVFNASNIAALKARCSNNMYVKNPTRVEAVCALLWKCAMNVVGDGIESVESSSVAQFAVNLRPRMVPSLTDSKVGNLIIATLAKSITAGQRELDVIVDQVHKAITRVDSDYIRKLQVNDGLSALFDSLKEVSQLSIEGKLVTFMFSSWCRFPFYEADFGWGKPKWLTSINMACPNIMVLMDTRCGNGVEVLVSLSEEAMAKFECQPELLAFSSDNQMA